MSNCKIMMGISETELKSLYIDGLSYLLPLQQIPGEEPLLVVKGDGPYFYDARGKKYLDFMAGLFNINAGMNNKKIIEAAKKQLDELAYTHPGHLTIPKVKLAKKLAEITPGDLCVTYFGNSGSEANELAIKIAKVYTGRYKVIGMWGGYHGATYGALSACGLDLPRRGFDPFLPGFVHIPPPYCYRCYFGLTYPNCDLQCAKFLEKTILSEGPDTVAAFIGEPVLGMGGIIVPPKEFWPKIRQICDKYNIVLIADEVMTGFGRTGKMFACEHWNIVPDIMTLAKGLTSGYIPLGATIIRKRISDGYKDKTFSHIYTYSGHAVACATALAAIDVYIEENLSENSAKVGKYLLEKLKDIQDRSSIIGDVRGLGLFCGIELVKDKETKEPLVTPEESRILPPEKNPLLVIRAKCLEAGLNIGLAAGSVCRMVPPLIITEEHVNEATNIFEKALKEVESKFFQRNNN